MTRDYAKPSTTRTTGKKSTPKKRATGGSQSKKASKATKQTQSNGNKAFHICLVVIILGGFGFALYKLAQVPKSAIPTQNASNTTEQSQSTPQKPGSTAQKEEEKTKSEDEKARFQFYDLLQKSEVETDTVDAYTFKEKGVSEKYIYMIQTGSFRSKTDAERQKATIAFQGLKTTIKAVKSDKGSTWYRVETGPFQSRSTMNAALDKLYAINIQPLVKKSKK